MPYLIVREPGQVAVSLLLREGFCVGRLAPSDLLLPYQQVSRQHACFEHDDEGGWVVRDLGSANGLFFNGIRADIGQLKDGDVIQIGPVKLTFTESEGAEIAHAQPLPTPDTLEPPGADRRLRMLFEVTRAIGALSDPDELLGRMLDAMLDLLGCERALAALREGGDEEPLRQVLRTREGRAPQGEVVVSRAILQALLVRREVVIIRDARERGAPHTLVTQGILSAMGAPLEAGGHLFGFLYVDHCSQASHFAQEDLDFLGALARLTAAALHSAQQHQRALSAAEAAGSSPDSPRVELLGDSPPMLRLKAQIRKFGASGSTNMLIRGESGTGKERVARAMHAASPRAQRPFVSLNCAVMPETTIEGELFGYVQGAFPGATHDKRGRFALAHRGSLFLDEIGDLSLAAQAKVLRVLQEGEVLPLGAGVPQRVDVRVFAATQRDLRREVAEGRFREDLFFRLNVGDVEVPPLRERVEDIAHLAQVFLAPAALNLGKRLDGFAPQALQALQAYAWPGNVRELRNEIERAAIQAEGLLVELDDLSPAVSRAVLSPSFLTVPGMSFAARFATLEPMERALCEDALAAARGNVAEAARLLGITRIMLVRRIERFGLRSREP
ncbi:sigma-54-dependent Fis family transcriptional regulator [Chondromyces apiculatus]|uniref:FHA domain-containing protein n=1 Tax=Chondromyces apiculatus DSM 436 TaxID=1192034 RepID=A0A017T723_9BACT|nr:sigma-54-dependent Fis family transcriptional regulator [Chondromyces apiculatus]EYF04396.1 Hypothetical protein CAP_4535 [Chondromyces apiculatus DSM 436]